jgi:hypothetical protein
MHTTRTTVAQAGLLQLPEPEVKIWTSVLIRAAAQAQAEREAEHR